VCAYVLGQRHDTDWFKTAKIVTHTIFRISEGTLNRVQSEGDTKDKADQSCWQNQTESRYT
jgi:hypothetical protein